MRKETDPVPEWGFSVLNNRRRLQSRGLAIGSVFYLAGTV
jgi:hypothetical protein